MELPAPCLSKVPAFLDEPQRPQPDKACATSKEALESTDSTANTAPHRAKPRYIPRPEQDPSDIPPILVISQKRDSDGPELLRNVPLTPYEAFKKVMRSSSDLPLRFIASTISRAISGSRLGLQSRQGITHRSHRSALEHLHLLQGIPQVSRQYLPTHRQCLERL